MNKYGLPAARGAKFTYMAIKHDGDAIVTTDWHSPFYNEQLAVQMLDTAVSMGIKTLIRAGDTYDFNYLSTYRRALEDRESNLDTDIGDGKKMNHALAKVFDKIIDLPGNHETNRIKRALGDNVSMETIFRWFVPDSIAGKFKLSKLPYCIINTNYGEVRVTHPKSFGKTPLAVAKMISNTTNQHVMMAHGHRFAFGYSDDGLRRIAETGGMFDVERAGYIQLDGDTNYSAWVNGYWVIKDGVWYPFSGGIGA